MGASETTRQDYESHRTNPACAACHAIMDNVGFGFEEFDAEGRYRTTENGLPIDASGMIVNLDGKSGVPFNGALELNAQLAASLDARNCVARQWFHFALARDDVDDDSCSLRSIQQPFAQVPNMRDLVVAIATSTAFRYAAW
jgi:hypothetical protein